LSLLKFQTSYFKSFW